MLCADLGTGLRGVHSGLVAVLDGWGAWRLGEGRRVRSKPLLHEAGLAR